MVVGVASVEDVQIVGGDRWGLRTVSRLRRMCKVEEADKLDDAHLMHRNCSVVSSCTQSR